MWLAVMLATTAAAGEPSSEFVLHVTSRTAPVEITWTLRGYSGDVEVCANRDGGRERIRKLRMVAGKALEPDDDDDDCWDAVAPEHEPLRLTYSYDMDDGDTDTATLVDGGFIFTDDAVLLRPEPLPPGGRIAVEFRVPPGWNVVAPWTRLPGDALRFETTSEQYDGSSYVGVGVMKSLGALPVRGGAYDVALMGTMNHLPLDVLREWIRNAGTDVAELYGGLPAPRVEVILVPLHAWRTAGVFGSGVFGTTMRRGHPSVVILFAANAPASAFAGDWLPEHELFHLGNPATAGRIAWFTEGTATYYQDVLRGRTHRRDPLVMWGDFYDNFREACQPEHGRSLGWASSHLGEDHSYGRVYWGGACLLFRADVAIRQHSNGTRSLDDVVRDLLVRGRTHPLTEDQIVKALDDAAGRPIASEQLNTTQPVSLDGLYRELGIEPTGSDTVVLHDDAPLANIRRGIFE